MDKLTKYFFYFFVFLGMTIMTGVIMAVPLKLCWDATMPSIFGLPEITYLQAWCLHFVSGSLIKSHLLQEK